MGLTGTALQVLVVLWLSCTVVRAVRVSGGRCPTWQTTDAYWYDRFRNFKQPFALKLVLGTDTDALLSCAFFEFDFEQNQFTYGFKNTGSDLLVTGSGTIDYTPRTATAPVNIKLSGLPPGFMGAKRNGEAIFYPIAWPKNVFGINQQVVLVTCKSGSFNHQEYYYLLNHGADVNENVLNTIATGKGLPEPAVLNLACN